MSNRTFWKLRTSDLFKRDFEEGKYYVLLTSQSENKAMIFSAKRRGSALGNDIYMEVKTSIKKTSSGWRVCDAPTTYTAKHYKDDGYVFIPVVGGGFVVELPDSAYAEGEGLKRLDDVEGLDSNMVLVEDKAGGKKIMSKSEYEKPRQEIKMEEVYKFLDGFAKNEDENTTRYKAGRGVEIKAGNSAFTCGTHEKISSDIVDKIREVVFQVGRKLYFNLEHNSRYDDRSPFYFSTQAKILTKEQEKTIQERRAVLFMKEVVMEGLKEDVQSQKNKVQDALNNYVIETRKLDFLIAKNKGDIDAEVMRRVELMHRSIKNLNNHPRVSSAELDRSHLRIKVKDICIHRWVWEDDDTKEDREPENGLYGLGDYEITIPLMADGRIEAFSEQQYLYNGNYTHPHADPSVCLGSEQSLAREGLAKGNYELVFESILDLLETYNNLSPYSPYDDFKRVEQSELAYEKRREKETLARKARRLKREEKGKAEEAKADKSVKITK